MIDKALYPVIFKRKSVRKFEKEPLDDSVLQRIEEKLHDLEPLFPEIKTKLAVVGNNEIGGIFAIKAPHYIALYSEEKDGYLLNAGYLLQQMDLYLSSEEIGTLWLGLAKPEEKLKAKDGLPYVITLAFGKAKVPVHRNHRAEFKRKDLSEITNLSGAKSLLEAVRLAPSSTNNQPWYLEGTEEELHVYCKKMTGMKSKFFPLAKKWLPVDVGIALCHLKISALDQGKEVEFVKENREAINEYQYMITVKLK